MALFGAKDFELKDKRKLGKHAGGVSSLAVSNKLIASAATDKHDIWLWDAQNGNKLSILQGHSKKVQALAIASGEDKLASASEDKTIRVWELSSMKEIFNIKRKKSAHSLAFHPEDKWLAVGEENGTVSILELYTGKEEDVLQLDSQMVKKILKKKPEQINNIEISPEGAYLAAVESEGSAIVWELGEEKSATILVSPPNKFFSTDFSHDGKYLLATGGSYSITISMEVGGAAEIKISDFSGVLLAYELQSRKTKKISTNKVVFEHSVLSGDGKKIIVLASVPPSGNGLKKVLYSYAFESVLEENNAILEKPQSEAKLGRGALSTLADFGLGCSPFALEMKEELFVWQLEL